MLHNITASSKEVQTHNIYPSLCIAHEKWYDDSRRQGIHSGEKTRGCINLSQARMK